MELNLNLTVNGLMEKITMALGFIKRTVAWRNWVSIFIMSINQVLYQSHDRFGFCNCFVIWRICNEIQRTIHLQLNLEGKCLGLNTATKTGPVMRLGWSPRAERGARSFKIKDSFYPRYLASVDVKRVTSMLPEIRDPITCSITYHCFKLNSKGCTKSRKCVP